MGFACRPFPFEPVRLLPWPGAYLLLPGAGLLVPAGPDVTGGTLVKQLTTPFVTPAQNGFFRHADDLRLSDDPANPFLNSQLQGADLHVSTSHRRDQHYLSGACDPERVLGFRTDVNYVSAPATEAANHG